MKPLRAASLAVLLAAPAAATSGTPRFKVKCELHGRHGSDIDRIAPERELQLVQDALADVYPLLPPNLQEVARRSVFVVNHNNKKLTKRYMGWGPEDDPEYEYPDTHFYPEKYVDAKGVRRRGTIKANITEKFIQTMDLGTELGRNNALAAAGVRTFGRQFFAHEVTHERQYHAGPVQDLASVSGAVVNGLARRKVLEETKRKINYERQAFEVDRRYGLGHEKELLALADALEEYAKAHPEEFGEKGSRRLLALDAPNPVVGRYLREETQNINLGNRFPPTAVIIYEGQYIPAELVWKLKQLNDTNTAIRRGVQTMGVSLPPLHLQAKVMGIRSDWNRYMKAGPISQALKDSFPYLKDVEKRFNAEMHRFNRPGSLR